MNTIKGEVVAAYPARTNYRGFDTDVEAQGFKNVSKYLKENINEIESETRE